MSQTGSYYDGFITDDRGIRNYIAYNKFKNELGTKLFIDANNTLSASIEHRSITLNQDPVEDQRNELYLNSTLKTQIKNIFNLSATGFLGLLDASANLGLKGRISFNHDKWGNVFGDLGIYQRRPYLLEESLYINQLPVYQLDFKNVNQNVVGVGFFNPNWNMEAGLKWRLLNNTIYYDQQKLPVQIDNAVSIRQLYLNKDFRFGKFRLRNRIAFQNFDESSLAIPSIIVQSGFSYHDRIFRNLLLFQTGVDFRITDGYNGVNYFPVSGQFHLDDSSEIESYPGLDFFLTIQLRSLKAFFKMDNINGYFTERHYFNVINYPQFETYFRFGFSFQLYN